MQLTISLISANIVIPILALFLNIIVRNNKNIPQSTGADILLLLLVFDSAAMIGSKEFLGMVNSPFLQENLYSVFLNFLWVGFLFWFIIIQTLEKNANLLNAKLTSFNYENDKKQIAIDKFKMNSYIVISWIIIICTYFAHIYSIVFKEVVST